jgi:hypothetical protein
MTVQIMFKNNFLSVDINAETRGMTIQWFHHIPVCVINYCKGLHVKMLFYKLKQIVRQKVAVCNKSTCLSSSKTVYLTEI